MAKHYLSIDLSVLSSRESSIDSEYDGFDASEGGEVKSPIPYLLPSCYDFDHSFLCI